METVKWHEDIELDTWKVLVAETLILSGILFKISKGINLSRFQMLYAQSMAAKALLSIAGLPICPQSSADYLKLSSNALNGWRLTEPVILRTAQVAMATFK